MSATEELRRLLDERGVEWVDTGDGSTLIPAQTAMNVAWDVNRWPSGKDMGDCLWVQNRHPLTPEQAIAATLGEVRAGSSRFELRVGREEGRRMSDLKPCPFCGGKPEKMTSDDGFTVIGCLYCNPLDGAIQNTNEFDAITAWNTRAERTCRNEDCDHDTWFKCSECRIRSNLEIMHGGCAIPNYCPNCGAKVVGE